MVVYKKYKFIMDNPSFIEKATESDLDDISQQILDMVYETEGKVVLRSIIQDSMILLLQN